MVNPTITIKKAWAMLPANVQLFLHGLGSAAIGGALAAAGLYFSDHEHHTLQAVQESWPVIIAGASAATALYLKNSPMPKWKWDRAVEKGEAIDRRASQPVLPPTVIVLPETPPGDPLNKKD